MRPMLQLLSEEELKYIDRLSRDILSEVGFVCEDEEAMSIFAEGGASVKRDKLVTFPNCLIDRIVETFSPVVKLFGREGRNPLSVGGDNVYYGTTGFATNYLDCAKGEFRASLNDDLVEMIRLCDVLDPPDYILPSICPTDIEPEYVDLYEFKEGILNTTKHIQTEAANRTNAQKILRMAKFIAGEEGIVKSKPFFSFLVTLTSPLHQRSDSMQLIIEGAQGNIPLFIESGPMAGATSPVTLAQTVAIANAELLSAITLAKLVNPTAPVIYASWARTINMRNGNVSVGCPEFGMLRVATSQMGKYYGLPVGGGGALSDSLSLDFQLGVEQYSTSLLPAIAGTNMIQGMGLLAGMNAASAEALIMASEVASYVGRVRQGIDVNADHSNFDLISAVGPSGDYLTTEHTLKNFKSELWVRSIFDCSTVKVGRDSIKKSVLNNVLKKKEDLLSRYRAPSLPVNAACELDAIIHS